MMKQEQFLDVIDRDLAEQRFRAAVDVAPMASETIALSEAWGRVLARDVIAQVDVPSFDRSNFDGFAVQAADTYGATEQQPRTMRLLDEHIAAGVVPAREVVAGVAAAIATGAILPRGADSVVMIEDTDVADGMLVVRRAVTPGSGVSFAGTDVAATETVLRRGELLTSRETGVLAAIGRQRVEVVRHVAVGIISTGDEIVEPGSPMQPGRVYDSNARILADAVRELGGEPRVLGIVRDDPARLRAIVSQALEECDVIILSGGTSKGAGDLSYSVVRELTRPGIVVHGVALKPGKPICLASHHGKPVAVLPGFPTSAIFTFHEFVAPIIRQLAGRDVPERPEVPARLAVRINSEIGRTEYVLVGLVHPVGDRDAQAVPSAYPMGKGSGSVTTFSRADGFVTVARHEEILEAGSDVSVTLISPRLRLADLVVIGSHCVGLDYLLGQLQDRHVQTKFLAVGSTSGLEAARRGECDLAGIHLLDAQTNSYNTPFLSAGLELIPGYRRMQGIVFRLGDQRFEKATVQQAIERATRDPRCMMINRNRGSGTRILVDQLLHGAQPAGYPLQSRSHNAVAAAVAQGRADWGLAIENVARQAGLGFLPVREEQYDFVVPAARRNRPAIALFRQLLADPAVMEGLIKLGCQPGPRE